MKKTLHIVLIAAAALTAGMLSVVHSQSGRGGYQKPELLNATTVTRADLAPLKLSSQELWYNAVVDDPRHGRYKVGYHAFSTRRNNDGNIVIRNESVFDEKVYNFSMSKSMGALSETISPETGRTLEISFKGTLSGRTFWSFGMKLPPESSISVDKTARFDWNARKIYITYGEGPNAPTKAIPLEENSIFSNAPEIFMLSLKGRVPGRVYRFRVFNPHYEKFEDIYIKHEGEKGKGIFKYSTVQRGWGDEMLRSWWVGPPAADAPEGKFEKIIADPQVWRYMTFLPVKKEEALKPTTPIID